MTSNFAQGSSVHAFIRTFFHTRFLPFPTQLLSPVLRAHIVMDFERNCITPPFFRMPYIHLSDGSYAFQVVLCSDFLEMGATYTVHV